MNSRDPVNLVQVDSAKTTLPLWGNLRPQNGGANLQKGASLFPLLQDGEDGNVLRDPVEEIASVEEVLLYPDTAPKLSFRFWITSQLPSERLVSSEHWWDCSPNPKDRRHYCIQVRLMLGDGGGDQPLLSHVWGGCLSTDTLQGTCPEDQITEAMVLSPGEAILFFGRCFRNEGLPYCRERNIKFVLGDPFNWDGRPTQIEPLRKTMQEGHCAINEAVVKKKMKARGPGWLQGKVRNPRTPAVVYDVEE